MARVSPLLMAVWARLRPALARLRGHLDSLRAPHQRAGSRSLGAAPRTERRPVAGVLPEEFEPAARSPWLARVELLVLCGLALFAALDRSKGSHAGPIAGFVVLAVVLLTLATFRRGQAVLLRRGFFAAVVLLVPHGGPALPAAAALATSLSCFTLVDALAGLRGLRGLAPVVQLPAGLLRFAPYAYSGVAAALAALSLRTASPSQAGSTLLAVWIAMASVCAFSFAIVLAQLRRLELGAAPRAWGAALCFVAGAVAAAFAVLATRAPALSALAAAFVTASTVAAHVAGNFDALRAARHARRLGTLVVFGTPTCLFLALLAADEPVHRSLVTLVAFLVGTAVAVWHRDLAELTGSGRSPWSRYLAEARGTSERRHPFEAVTRALERVQHAPMLGRSPAVLVFETGERLEVDRAGYVRRRQVGFPRELLAVALGEPFAAVREEVLHALEVRRPDLRALLAWLDADDLLAACVGIADGEPVCALLLPRAQRDIPLSLDELFEAKRLADVLAGHLAILEERRQSGARVDRLEKRLVEEEERAQLTRYRAERRGHARRLNTERLARRAMSVPVAPKSRLLQEALDRAAARGQGAFVVTAPGNDAIGQLARAHLQGPRANEAFVVVDGTQPHTLERWQDPLRSPLLGADRGTLVLQDVRAIPLSVQRFIAHVHAERRLPGGEAEPIDVVLVLTAREAPQRLLETGELASELLDRLAGATPHAMPDMSERAEDLRALLVEKLAREGLRAHGRPIGIADAAFAVLVEHMFLAGESELDALTVALCRVAPSGVVQLEDLQRVLSFSGAAAAPPGAEESPRARGAKASSRPSAAKSVATRPRSTRHRR